MCQALTRLAWNSLCLPYWSAPSNYRAHGTTLLISPSPLSAHTRLWCGGRIDFPPICIRTCGMPRPPILSLMTTRYESKLCPRCIIEIHQSMLFLFKMCLGAAWWTTCVWHVTFAVMAFYSQLLPGEGHVLPSFHCFSLDDSGASHSANYFDWSWNHDE